MNIDIFTLIAQIINLIILLFLLRKFLYVPVLKAVEERQRVIATELQQAAEARQTAENKHQEWLQKIHDLEVQKQDILQTAHAEAQQMADKLFATNKQTAEFERQRWHEQLQSERQNFELALQQLVVEHFNRFASQALRQLSGASLNLMTLEKFKEKFEQMSQTEKTDFAHAVLQNSTLRVQTAYRFSNETEVRLAKFLRDQLTLPEDIPCVFEVKPELVSGVCVAAGEQVIAWNFESYLQEFHRRLSDEVMQLLSRG